jgi:hypothetical protein
MGAGARERPQNLLCRLRAGSGNALRFPRPRGTLQPGPVKPAPTEASARPGGCEAPAMGGTGAGRGLWPPAVLRSAWRCSRGYGPCHDSGPGDADSGRPAPSPDGPGSAARFPEGARRTPKTGATRTTKGQRPPGRGERVHTQRVAGAMALPDRNGRAHRRFPVSCQAANGAGAYQHPFRRRLRRAADRPWPAGQSPSGWRSARACGAAGSWSVHPTGPCPGPDGFR